jgi:predicted lipoprotein
MYRLFILLLLTAITLTHTGCKLVFDKDESDAEIPADQSGDKARNNLRLQQTFESRLLPHIKENALPLEAFRKEVAGGLDSAGSKFANRGAGQGAAWNFPIASEGIVVEAKLDTRARWVDVDTDKDGKADIKIQLGPVIRGTALRDVAPFYNFDDFRDQIEFARLSRAINDRIKALLEIPEGELAGRSVKFTGVIAIKKASDKLLLTPIQVEFSK